MVGVGQWILPKIKRQMFTNQWILFHIEQRQNHRLPMAPTEVPAFVSNVKEQFILFNDSLLQFFSRSVRLKSADRL